MHLQHYTTVVKTAKLSAKSKRFRFSFLVITPTILSLIGITLGTVLLMNYIEHVENAEIEFERNKITQLFEETIEIKTRQFDIISDSVEAFYQGSEKVTRDEFETFVLHLLKDSDDIANIAVYDEDKIVLSYPLREYIGMNINSVGKTFPDNDLYLVLTHDEKDVEVVSTMLFIKPEEIVPISSVLNLPYKLILYVDGERLFGLENDGYERKFQYVSLSQKERQNALVISTELDFEGHEKHDTHNFEYIVYQSNFVSNIEEFRFPVFFAGFGIGIVIAVLLFFSLNYNQKIREANIELKINAELLKKTQRLLLESEEKFRNLFELSPVPVSTIDLNGKLTSANQQAANLFGYSKEEITGKHFTKFVAEIDREKSINQFKEIISTGRTTEARLVCKKKDGSTFHTLVSGSTLIDKNFQVVGIIVVATPLD